MADLIRAFADLAAWNEFQAGNPFISDPDYIASIVRHAKQHGVDSSFLGRLGPERIEVRDANYRESLLAGGLSPRQRAVMELMAAEPWIGNQVLARIYAAEALTPFARTLRWMFPRFLGSEYASDDKARAALYPIEFQDLTRLTLPSDMFDCVITNDVLEHVYSIDACLSELARVLRPSGVMLSTFPFSFRYENIVRARMAEGGIEHLTEPEYHGNPAEPEKGSLVFAIPGWQVLEAARSAGFGRAEMVFLSSIEKGITGAEIAGILILRCYK